MGKISEETKLNIRLYVAVLLIIVGCGLLIAGFTVNPVGEIHSSVLVAFGEACTFAGAVLGIDYSYRFNIFKGKLGKSLKKE